MTSKPWPCLKCLVIMKQVDEDHCKCPTCGTEVWYEYKDAMESPDEIDNLMQETANSHRVTTSSILSSGAHAHGGGGSSSKGSRKKDLMKKPSTNQIYRQLTS